MRWCSMASGRSKRIPDSRPPCLNAEVGKTNLLGGHPFASYVLLRYPALSKGGRVLVAIPYTTTKSVSNLFNNTASHVWNKFFVVSPIVPTIPLPLTLLELLLDLPILPRQIAPFVDRHLLL